MKTALEIPEGEKGVRQEKVKEEKVGRRWWTSWSRKIVTMLVILIAAAILSCTLVYSTGAEIKDDYLSDADNALIGLIGQFNISQNAESGNSFENPAESENAEKLPIPQQQVGPEARNYVAYIPVPINDDEEDEEYDDEYYDDDEEYYDDDEYYEDEEDEPPKKKKPSKRRKSNRRQDSNRRRGGNRRPYYDEDENDEDEERVPFLVPLMMVPENQVGVQKEFSFSQGPQTPPQKDGIFSNVLNQNRLGNINRPPPGLPPRPNNRQNNFNNNFPPNRRFGNQNRFGGPPARPVHDVPGPPYKGPPPRNPRLPMDDTVIHPSVNRFRFRRPPRNFRPPFNQQRRPPMMQTFPQPPPSTTTTTTPAPTTTTTEATTTKIRPQVIIMQPGAGGYRPYQPYGYGGQYPQYPPPSYYPPPAYQQPAYPPPTPTTTTTTSTTTTTVTTTTTKKPKRRRKKKTKLSQNRLNSLSQGGLTIMNNKLVPLKNVPNMIANNNNMQTMLAQPSHNNQMFNNNNNNMFSNRMGMISPPSGRRMQPKGIVRGRRRFPGPPTRGMRNMRRPEKMRGQRNNFRRYVEYPRVPAREPGNRRFDMPNIYSQVIFS